MLSNQSLADRVMNSANKNETWLCFLRHRHFRLDFTGFHSDFITLEVNFKLRFLCHYLTESLEILITSE